MDELQFYINYKTDNNLEYYPTEIKPTLNNNAKMESNKYTTITSKEQFKEYRAALKALLGDNDLTAHYDEMELLTYYIDKWEQEQNNFGDLNPIELLKSLMLMHKLKSKHMVEILGISKELVSDLLNYRKGLSKDNIQILSNRFSISPEAFNRPYKLKSPVKGHPRTDNIVTTHK